MATTLHATYAKYMSTAHNMSASVNEHSTYAVERCELAQALRMMIEFRDGAAVAQEIELAKRFDFQIAVLSKRIAAIDAHLTTCAVGTR
jgi:hypothetical protein